MRVLDTCVGLKVASGKINESVNFNHKSLVPEASRSLIGHFFCRCVV